MNTSGYKHHSRNGEWNKGEIVQTDVPFVIEHDRDIQFPVDRADVDESNQTATVQNISEVFIAEHYIPEIDARFFEKCAKAAKKSGFYQTEGGWTPANTYSRLVKLFQSKSLKPYRSMGGLIAYVRGDIMDCLESSSEITKTFDIKTVAINEGNGLSTRITSINGVTIIEVIDDARFYGDFDYSDDFKGVGPRLNVLIAHPSLVRTVPKINSIYFRSPDEQSVVADAYLYQNRALWDTFVFPNGKDGKTDAVYADFESDEPSVTNYPTKSMVYTVNGTDYVLTADGTLAEIAADGEGNVDYIIGLAGKAAKVASAAATGIWGSATVKNNAIFLVEIDDTITHYGRGTEKVVSGLEAIQDSDKLTIGNTLYLVIAKGIKANGDIFAGEYFSIGTGASAVTKSFKIDASGLTLA